MEISVLIGAIGALCGVIGYLYRELQKVNKTVVRDLRDELARIKSEIKVLRNDDVD